MAQVSDQGGSLLASAEGVISSTHGEEQKEIYL
jgi:hypothetical protein